MSLLLTVLVAASASGTPTQRTPISVSVGPIIEAFRPVALAAAPTGPLIAAAMEDGTVRIINGKTHQTVRVMQKHVQPAYALAFSNDGAVLASGDESGRVWLENALTGKAIRGYRTHTKGVEKLSFNSFGNLLISTGKDDQVNVYDLTTKVNKEARHILGHGENFYGAVFDPQSTRFFTVGMLGGGMRKYDALTGEPVAFFADPNGQGIWDVAYNPNGTREVSGGRDGNAIVWDPKTAKKISALKGHQDWVVTAAVSPNGVLAATGSTDRTVKVWNLQSLTKVADISQQCAVGSPLCFTADGTSLVTVTDQGFLEFNTLTPVQAQVASLSVAPKMRSKRARRAGA